MFHLVLHKSLHNMNKAICIFER